MVRRRVVVYVLLAVCFVSIFGAFIFIENLEMNARYSQLLEQHEELQKQMEKLDEETQQLEQRLERIRKQDERR